MDDWVLVDKPETEYLDAVGEQLRKQGLKLKDPKRVCYYAAVVPFARE